MSSIKPRIVLDANLNEVTSTIGVEKTFLDEGSGNVRKPGSILLTPKAPQYIRKYGFTYMYIGLTSEKLLVYQIVLAAPGRKTNKKTVLPPN